MKPGKILVVGGYGKVGRTVATLLGNQFPGHVIAGGRNIEKAELLSRETGRKVIPLAMDVSKPFIDIDALLTEVSLVIVCLDLPDSKFVEQCLQQGVNYIDITANGDFMSQVGLMNHLARTKGNTAVLSVGLAPGLTNLLAKHAMESLGMIKHLDIFILLGLGEAHGEAAIHWMIKNLGTDITVYENGTQIRVRSFEQGKLTSFPGLGQRVAYRFNFPEQKTLPETLGLDSVSTWFCFDSQFVTKSLASLQKIGALQILNLRMTQDIFVKVFKTFQFGSDDFVLQVEAASRDENPANTARFIIRGKNEARATAKVAAAVANSVITNSLPAGVFHIEQLFEPLPFIERIIGDGIEFESE